MAEFLGVKNFDKHQHYKDRDPVWIKFYVAVLSDVVITRLPDAAQCQLFKFWLLASRHGNRIPYDLKHIKEEIRPQGKFYLKELLAIGFLELVEENASKNIEKSSLAFARAREEVRGKRLEPDNSTTTTPREVERTAGELAVLGAAPPEKHHRLGLLWNGWREGLGMPAGKPAEDQDISAGLLEYLNNHDTPDFKAAHMVAYVGKARTRRLKSDDSPRGRGGSFLDVA